MSRFTTERGASLIDLNVMQGIVPSTAEFKVAFGFGSAGTALAGLQKAAQKFMVMFLTDKGSAARDPEIGTDFLYDVASGRLRTDSDVTLYFKLAAQGVLDYMSAQVTDATPDEEILTTADVTWIRFEYPRLLIGIKLTSQAGESASVVLPLSAVEVT